MVAYTNDFGINVTTSAYIFKTGEGAAVFASLCRDIDEAKLDIYYEAEDENDLIGDYRYDYQLSEVKSSTKKGLNGFKVVIVDAGV